MKHIKKENTKKESINSDKKNLEELSEEKMEGSNKENLFSKDDNTHKPKHHNVEEKDPRSNNTERKEKESQKNNNDEGIDQERNKKTKQSKKTKKNKKEKESQEKNSKKNNQQEKTVDPVDIDSPFDYSNIKDDDSQPVKSIDINQKPKKRKKNRKVWKIVLVVVIILLCAASVAGAALYSFLNSSFDDDSDDALNAKAQLTETTFGEPFYMVLVGTDTRAEQQDTKDKDKKTYSLTGGRSDTCVLVRVDPKEYVVSMLSIPRDTQVTINGRTEKFNAAYNYGGIASTIEQVKKLCNVDISHYAEVSFNGLTDMVDAVGGVDVDVPNAINDPKSGAPVPKGMQHLDGEQALSFARSRNFADGDFTRSSDQRILIEALINKAYNLSVGDLPGVLKAAKNFVRTDLKLNEMISLATSFKNASQLTIYSSMVPSTTGTVGGASYCFTDKEALSRQMKMMENNENIALVEITSGASVCSARDKAALEAQQKEYYATHPDSPGRATSASAKSTSEVYKESPSGSKSSGSSGGNTKAK